MQLAPEVKFKQDNHNVFVNLLFGPVLPPKSRITVINQASSNRPLKRSKTKKTFGVGIVFRRQWPSRQALSVNCRYLFSGFRQQ